MWGPLSDEMTGLSLKIAFGLASAVILGDPRPYFTVSELRLPNLSPPTTRRVTVELFDLASTRGPLNYPESESESYVTNDGQSASLSWYKALIRGLRPDFYCRTEHGIRNTSDSYVLDTVGRPL
jgi:hypothetical protein